MALELKITFLNCLQDWAQVRISVREKVFFSKNEQKGGRRLGEDYKDQVDSFQAADCDAIKGGLLMRLQTTCKVTKQGKNRFNVNTQDLMHAISNVMSL